MKSIFRSLIPVFCLAAAISLPASSSTIYQATLAGSNEVPPTGVSGTGLATLTLSTDQTMLTVDLSFTGLTGAAAAGHIHCCVAPGTNGPVALPFTGLPSTTSGTYTNTFTLATPGVLINGVTAAQLIAGLASGAAYVNLHTPQFPNGEIRGLITATPEPATALLFALPLAGLVALRRRQTV